MALPLKRLLNDNDYVPIYGDESRPRLSNGCDRFVELLAKTATEFFSLY
jgi:hypothetical protein